MPQNYLKTASKLLDLLWYPLHFWQFWGKKKCLETFGLVETPPLEKTHIWETFFSLKASLTPLLSPFIHFRTLLILSLFKYLPFLLLSFFLIAPSLSFSFAFFSYFIFPFLLDSNLPFLLLLSPFPSHLTSLSAGKGGNYDHKKKRSTLSFFMGKS